MTGEEVFADFLQANVEAQEVIGVPVGQSPWAGSPFEWLMGLPSRRRGSAGELIAAAWLRRLGFTVARPLSGDHDRLVNSHKIEIKLSTLWESGVYKFQQLRDQDYEYALLLGVSPQIAHAWLVPKTVAMQRSTPQHGGARGTDTRWISFPAASPPEWLLKFGGSLSSCIDVVRTTLG